MLDFLKKKNPDLHEYHRNSHSKYLIQYHFVFAVKYRKKLLTGEIKDDIRRLLRLRGLKYELQRNPPTLHASRKDRRKMELLLED